MSTFHATTLMLSGGVVAVGLLAGCGSSDQPTDNPTTPGTITTGVSQPSATTTTQAPSSTAAETTAPATGGSQAPTTELTPGPSQTVSGGNSATPPPVQKSASPPTGDNLPGENGGPQGVPGEPGRN